MHMSRQRSGTMSGNPADHTTVTKRLRDGIAGQPRLGHLAIISFERCLRRRRIGLLVDLVRYEVPNP